MSDLIVSVPDHCLSFYFSDQNAVSDLYILLSFRENKNSEIRYL